MFPTEIPGPASSLEIQAENLVIATFQEYLETDVFLWTDRRGWEDTAHQSRTFPSELIMLPVDELHRWGETRQQPTLVEQSPNEWLFITAVQEVGAKSYVVAGKVSCRDQASLTRELRTILSLLRHRWQNQVKKLELEKFTEQVSDDWEELTWLRSLSSHLEVCDVSRKLPQVLSRVLISLRELVHAEMLCFLPQVSADQESRRAGVLSVVHAGQNLLPETQLRQLLERIGTRSSRTPVVRNHLRETLSEAAFTDLRNIVAVPVSKGFRQFGWLLAINKQSRGGEQSGSRTLYGETEFGTPEAGVMGAAAAMLATHATNLAMFDEREALVVGVIRAMVSSLDARDPYTCGHSERVALIAIRLADYLGYSDTRIDELYLTGLLHDIGKIGIEDKVLMKPGRLSDEEFVAIQQHPLIGYNILQHLAELKFVLDGVLHHHEAWDGSGYPHQLAAENIPLDARILAVADAYDAMTSTRPYRFQMEPQRAQSVLQDNAGTQWDPVVVEAFFACLEDIQSICNQVPRKPLQELERVRQRRAELDPEELAALLKQREAIPAD